MSATMDFGDDGLDNVIFFGHVGAGKTTLVNLLSGSRFRTTDLGDSCTRLVQHAPCIYQPFRVVDFPGTDAAVDIVKHAQVQAQALKSMHFTVVCIVQEATPRKCDLTLRCVKLLRLFSNHTTNLVTIITHSEMLPPNSKERDDISLHLHHTLHVDHVFFKDNKTAGTDLASWIYKFINPTERDHTLLGIPKMPRVERGQGIFLTDRFNDLVADTTLDSAILQSRDELATEFKRVFQAHTADFKSTTSPERKRALYFSLKNFLDVFSDKHATAVAPKLTDRWDLTMEVITFQNQLRDIFLPFKLLVESNLTPERVVYNPDDTNPRYKKCPQCGLVWFRVYGCNGFVCGRRHRTQDRSNRTWYQYAIDWVGGALRVNELPVQPLAITGSTPCEHVGLTDEETSRNAVLQVQNKQVIRPLGCGAKGAWSSLKDVTDEVDDFLKQVEISLTGNATNIADSHVRQLATVCTPVTATQSRTASSHNTVPSGASPGVRSHASVATKCMECDTNICNVQFHPCQHTVVCSQCAAHMRKCPECRATITGKTNST
ncbi:hypothetical protein Pelo_18352 [Pelomyxa schiedti]|nr:hypothetical protein Pelo_18352 [Pelomyxa schiedti]